MTARRKRRVRQEATPTEASPVHARPRRFAVVAALLTFAVVFSALSVVGYSKKSATWDEPIHLTAGYAALARHDYRVDPTHPPFLRMWAALPLLVWHRPGMDVTSIDRYPAADWPNHAYDFSHEFMYVANDADQLLYAARFMVVLLGVGLGILLFAWTYEWLGFTAALFALAFYTISPNISAHASLVTTDAGITCFIFGTIYFLWRTWRRVSAFNVAGLALFFALAMVTKFSAIALGPIVVVLLAILTLQRSSPLTLRAACGIVVLLAASSVLAIWAVYGFRYAPSASPDWILKPREGVSAEAATFAGGVVSWIDAHRLLPNAYSQGLLSGISDAHGVRGYFAGEYSQVGWWYYFPLAFLIKTPVSFIALAVAGLAVFVRRWRRLGLANEAFVIVPVVLFMGIASASEINLGLRHILPIYPFVLLVALAGVNELWASRVLVGRIALGALALFWLVMFAGVYPHTLTFFNSFVGGPSHGAEYLVDSNLDWGQHLKLLKEWMDENDVAHVNLAYFGRADPAYYDIDCTYLPGGPSFTLDSIARPQLPGYVAISETVLSGVYLQPFWRVFYAGFHDRQPIADIGHSIRVYWVERWPEPEEASGVVRPVDARGVQTQGALATALFAQQWYDHAIVHYRRYLRYRPRDANALEALGSSLWAEGQRDEALKIFRNAVDVAPQSPESHRILTVALMDLRRDLAEASRHAQLAATLRPGDADAHELLGRSLAMQGRWEEAGAAFERALYLNPAHAGAHEDLQQLRRVLSSRR